LVNNSINTVVKGSGFILFGSVFSSILLLAVNIFIARIWGKNDLGIYALALSFLNLFSTIGGLGVANGVTRNLAYYKGKKDYKIIPDIITSSILLVTITSFLIAILLFVFSDYIAVNIFNNSSLKLPLIVFSFAIPINNITNILVSIFRGFKEIKPLVYIQQILKNTLFFSFIVILIITNQSFIFIIYVYLLTDILTCLTMIIYSYKKISGYEILSNVRMEFTQTKPLLLFSLPILATSILNTSTNWINTLMIGGLTSSTASVGLYISVVVITGFIGFPVGILLVLYMPVISNLCGSDKKNEIKRIYYILTKWLCFITLPIFLFLFLFSEEVIYFFYGQEYILGSITLKILLIGSIIGNFAGPNGSTLIAIGKPKLVMYSILLAAITNIGLNIFLIPEYGIEGAAVALMISVIIFNLIKNITLYLKIKVQPLQYNLIKPTILTIFVISVIFVSIKHFFSIQLWFTTISLIIFYAIYFSFYIITKSIDIEDINIINIIGKKLHINTNLITKIMLLGKK